MRLHNSTISEINRLTLKKTSTMLFMMSEVYLGMF